MPAQLPLLFNWQVPTYSFSNFYETEQNQCAYQSLLQLLQGDGGQCLYLWGEVDTGKSHLLQAACKFVAQNNATPVYLPFVELLEYSPEVLEGVNERDLVCIDDIHLIAGLELWERAVFTLFNQLREVQVPLVISSLVSPKALGLKLPDLASRLAWEGVFMLDTLPDESKLRVLQRYSADLGMELPESVGEYLLKHCSENLKALMSWLEKLDYASLANKRRLTVPFVREVLNARASSPT